MGTKRANSHAAMECGGFDPALAPEKLRKSGVTAPALHKRRGMWLAIGAVVLSASLPYCMTLNYPFVFDDHDNIESNASLRKLWPVWDLWTGPNMMRATVHTSLAINYAIDQALTKAPAPSATAQNRFPRPVEPGLHTLGYHIFNLAIHVLAALVLFGLVRRTLLTPRLVKQFGEWSTPLAAIVAAVWAAHSLQTQSVTYLIQRAESMMGLLYLLTIYCLVRGETASRTTGPERGVSPGWWYAAGVAACALGMVTKPVMVTAPFMAWLYDRVFLVPPPGQQRRHRDGFYVGLVGAWAVMAAAVLCAPPAPSAGFSTNINPWQYLGSQFGVILRYMLLSIWPAPSMQCMDPELTWVRQWQEWLPWAAIVAAMLAGTVVLLVRRPTIGFLGAWILVILAPSSSILPIADLMMEHRMYLPLAGVAGLLVLGSFAMLQRVRRRIGRSPLPGEADRPCAALIASWALVVIALGLLTGNRNTVYRSELAMWQDIREKYPTNARAWCNVGASLLNYEGKHAEAIPYLDKAIELSPGYADAHFDRGACLANLKDYKGAMVEFQKVLEIQPTYPAAIDAIHKVQTMMQNQQSPASP